MKRSKLLIMRKTKIICTLGPASRNENTIRDMLKAGMNVARINMSHQNHEYHKETIDLFRKVRDSLDMPAAVMLDTKGPEIRIGTFKNGIANLKNGSKFTLTTEITDGDDAKVFINYKNLPSQIKPGNRILVDDGRIALDVDEISGNDIICNVVSGGEISDRKGVNIPNVHLDVPYIRDNLADQGVNKVMVKKYISSILLNGIKKR